MLRIIIFSVLTICSSDGLQLDSRASSIPLLISEESKIVSCSNKSDGFYPKQGCDEYYQCSGQVVLDEENCGISSSKWKNLFSTTSRTCVATGFPDCEAMFKYCPLLSGKANEDLFDIDSFLTYRRNGSEPKSRIDQFISNFGKVKEGQFLPFERYSEDPDYECPDDFGTFGVGNQSEYRICVDNQAFAGFCNFGEVFDVRSSTCVALERFQQPEKVLDCSVTPDGIYSVVGNCRAFQVCCDGLAHIQRCPIGTLFDTVSKSCLSLFRAKC